MRRTDGVPEGSQPPRDRRAAVPPFGHEAAAAEAALCAPVRYRRCSTALRLRRDSGSSSELPAGRTRPGRHRRCSSSARREAEAFPYREAATSAAAAARKRCNIAMPLPVGGNVERGGAYPRSRRSVAGREEPAPLRGARAAVPKFAHQAAATRRVPRVTTHARLLSRNIDFWSRFETSARMRAFRPIPTHPKAPPSRDGSPELRSAAPGWTPPPPRRCSVHPKAPEAGGL
ncbi:uncharacterized protein LOC129212010 isoform X1 [Grus americana]|uniref:uncharacterized protein LOC129212010 isoform X1 n=1 Tax=Grus americana TaxID=9117 RepID=UPI002407D8E6|nr:uncharacterized protein LOC129212010 isoform X1 [Grus americana]XP_054695949.1 uncharacterized protein LOC129212010 isoform X1 [Grus americana]